MYSGTPEESGRNAEIIDLENPQADCESYAVLTNGVFNAFGGQVSNEYLLCGGTAKNEGANNKCYKVGETIPFLELLKPRHGGASVVLPDNRLFLTGDF